MRVTKSLVLACALLIGCGGGDSAATTDDDDFGDESAGGEAPGSQRHGSARELIGIGPPETPWSEMSHEEREMDMVARFLPITHEMFEAHDEGRYAGFGCETCHGDDMRAVEFRMPVASLPPVPPPGTDAYREMADSHPEDTRFMEEVLTPAMQTMLGMGATFTCNGCHPTVE